VREIAMSLWAADDEAWAASWRRVGRAGGVAAFLLLAYSAATMVQLTALGVAPETATEVFHLLQHHPIQGLARLDLPTMLAMPLYYLLFLGLASDMWRDDPGGVTVATVLAAAGVTLVLATPSSLSLLRHAATADPAARLRLEAAGEAILAADTWHATGAFVGALLLQAGAVWACVLMLRSRAFSRATAVVGIVTHALDLAHVALSPFAPRASFLAMAIAGPLYLLWFPLIGTRLLRVGSAPRRAP
jgi:hypothetical protein